MPVQGGNNFGGRQTKKGNSDSYCFPSGKTSLWQVLVLFFHGVDHRLECFGVVHGQVSQYFAVEGDAI